MNEMYLVMNVFCVERLPFHNSTIFSLSVSLVYIFLPAMTASSVSSTAARTVLPSSSSGRGRTTLTILGVSAGIERALTFVKGVVEHGVLPV